LLGCVLLVADVANEMKWNGGMQGKGSTGSGTYGFKMKEGRDMACALQSLSTNPVLEFTQSPRIDFNLSLSSITTSQCQEH